jgi:hypothetical protein
MFRAGRAGLFITLAWRGVAWRGVALGSESFMSAFSGALSKLLVQSHRVVTFFCDEGD